MTGPALLVAALLVSAVSAEDSDAAIGLAIVLGLLGLIVTGLQLMG